MSPDTAGAAADAPARLLLNPLQRPSRLRGYLSLTRELAVTSFKLKYAGSVLGYLWSLMKPAMVFGMMYVVFALFLLRGRTSAGENFPVELLIGIVLWTFFADATSASLWAVAGNGDMLKRARFPRFILVIAAVISASMTLLVNLVLVLVVGIPLHWYTIGAQTAWLPLLLLELVALCTGLGLALGALYVFFRDLSHIWEILLQLLFFASGIIFPFSVIPQKFVWLVALNPAAQIVEDVRRSLVSSVVPWTVQVLGVRMLVPVGLVLLSVVAGGAIFHLTSRRFGERV